MTITPHFYAYVNDVPYFKDRVIYVAVPYSVNPQAAVDYSMEICKQLVENGFHPFSPILHTHFFHEYFNKPDNIDYVAWDLFLLSMIVKEREPYQYSRKLVMGFPSINSVDNPVMGITDWRLSKGCMEEYHWAKQTSTKPNQIECIILPPLVNGEGKVYRV